MASESLIRRGLLITLAFGTLPRTALAQNAFQVEVATLASGTVFLADPPNPFAIRRQQATPLIVEGGEFRHALGVGVTAGARFGAFGAEGMFLWAPVSLSAAQGLEIQGNVAEMNTLTYGATLLYFLTRFGPLEPFAGVGLGAVTFSYDPELAWERRTEVTSNALAGVHLWMTDGLSLRLETRHFLVPFDSKIDGVDGATLNDLVLAAGLSFRAPRQEE
jgi:hypothetical protein